MIYLTTGANGTGKTLFTLRDVRDLQVATNRPVYYNGRFELLPAIESEFGWLKFEFKDWESLPDTSILLVDECHNDLPLRAASVPLPPYVSAIAEHRRRGFDFFLLTQHPQNIDVFVRRLIGAPGYHRHLRRVAGSNFSSHSRWDAVNSTCEKPGASKTAETTVKAFPKEVFGWYTSAVLHTSKFRLPKAFYILVLALVGAVASLYYGYSRVTHSAVPLSVGNSILGQPDSSPPASAPAKALSYADSRAAYLTARQPYIASLPHTSPVYARVTEPVRAPIPAACISSADKCSCYTQQATRLDTDDATCRSIVQTGYFVDFDNDRAAPLERGRESPSRNGGLGASEPTVGGQAKPAGDMQPVQYVNLGARAQ